MRVAIIGATGNAGRHIVRLLLNEPSAEVAACSRSETRLGELESQLGASAGRLRLKVVDLNQEAQLADIASSVDLVVGATSRSAHSPRIASVAVECGAHYIGLYLSDAEKWRKLRQLQARCLEREVMVVGDGGCHPGLPAAMVRLAAKQARLKSAWVAAKFGLRWDMLKGEADTIDDFLHEIESTDPSVLINRAWVRGYRYARRFDFGHGSGSESCIPMCIEEIRELADSGAVDSTGFFMAGFGPILDYGILPIATGLAKVNRRWASSLLWWGLRYFASAAEQGDILLEAESLSDSEPIRIRVSHPDPYVLTAVPVVAAIYQMLTSPRPGVWTQAGFIEPVSFFEQIERMGVVLETR